MGEYAAKVFEFAISTLARAGSTFGMPARKDSSIESFMFILGCDCATGAGEFVGVGVVVFEVSGAACTSISFEENLGDMVNPMA